MSRARHTTRRALVISGLALAAWTLVGPCRSAHAHGGRIKPPPPKFKPGDTGPVPGRVPTDPPPMRFPTPNLPGGEKPQGPPTTPGAGDPGSTPRTPGADTGGAGRPYGASRRGRPTSATPVEDSWQTWWELNRWGFFPERRLGGVNWGAVVTPSGDRDDGIDRAALEHRRRALVRRQSVLPFLLTQLEPTRRVRDEVRAAALLALGRLTQDDAALELLFRYAEHAKASGLVRESAALAAGLIRRDADDAAVAGAALDRVRERLLTLVDDGRAPDRTRAFAALAVGLLGDQPFGSAFTREGRVITRALWERAQRRESGRELPVALLTALGMQPSRGLSAEMRAGLQRIVAGRRHGGRTWDALERSHALAALARQEGPEGPSALLRVLTDRRAPPPLRRAAFIGLGAASPRLDVAARAQALEAAARGIDHARDNLSRGLGWIALGRLLGADLQAPDSQAAERSRLTEKLLAGARHGPRPLRGFAALGLALAARHAEVSTPIALRFRAAALETLAQGFAREGEANVRGAYAVALGLLGPAARETSTDLVAVLADRHADPEVRGHAALALAQIGAPTSDARRALRTALWDRRALQLRSQAALALSFLGGRAESTLLIQELRRARSQWVLSQVAAALGQLGDLDAVPAVLAIARDQARSAEARALAIASLGLLADPQSRPSLLRLTMDANYPAGTDSLQEAFSIL